MNAGAYGGEFADVVERVHFLDENLDECILEKKDLKFGYRESYFTDKEVYITKVEMKLEKGDKEKIDETMKDLINRRITKQPHTMPSVGSTFKRPENDYASRVIDVSGLRGRSVGGAQVSEKHCGFIVNTGGATSKDVIELTEIVKKEVLEKTGCILECEMQIIGD